jgi:diguanylate cyclase (GGDEF)-like protein
LKSEQTAGPSAAILPENEAARLEALRDFAILDTLPEQSFDDLTFLASEICGTPVALISLIDEERQWFKSKLGIEVAETPRDLAFCSHAIIDPGQLLIVDDASQDPRFADNPLVTSAPFIRFYAGAPLVTSQGDGLGTLCVIDKIPRQLSEAQQRALAALSRQAMANLELRKAVASLAEQALERQRYQQELEQVRHELEKANALLEHQTLTDSLTGLLNRRAFDQILEREIERSQRYSTPLSLALVDIDFFKQFNDEFGHLEGDTALRQTSELLARASRLSDTVARIGGEEFAIVLPGVDLEKATALGERVRKEVAEAAWPRRAITVSLGITQLRGSTDSRSQLLTRADQALYRAKNAGRNQVQTA